MAPILGNKMLRGVVGRFDGMIKRLVTIPTDDISNVITSFYMVDDPFNRIFGFVGFVIS